MNQNSRTRSQDHRASSLHTVARAVLIGGGALAVFGLTRRSRAGMALAAAGGLMAAGSRKIEAESQEYSAKASFAVNCSPEAAYKFWRSFENLPRFMTHLEAVKVLDNTRSEWVAIGPMNSRIRWHAEITEDRQNERIAWRSLPDSDLENNGVVEFRLNTAGRGTVVTVKISYRLAAGAAGRAVALLLGKSPEFTVREDLRHFKSLIEAGEVATTYGQTHGPRGFHGRVEQILFGERQNMARRQQSTIRKTA